MSASAFLMMTVAIGSAVCATFPPVILSIHPSVLTQRGDGALKNVTLITQATPPTFEVLDSGAQLPVAVVMPYSQGRGRVFIETPGVAEVTIDMKDRKPGEYLNIKVVNPSGLESMIALGAVYIESQNACFQGTFGVGPSCQPCPRLGTCPGDNRVRAVPSMCNASARRDNRGEKVFTMVSCTPAEACPNDFVVGRGRETEFDTAWDSGVARCAAGYRNDADDGESCCESCDRGFCRFGGRCVSCPRTGFKAWNAVLLTVVLAGLGLSFWRGRRRTVWFFPVLLQVFRMAQSISLIALDVSMSCSYGNTFTLEASLFPVFSGLIDYFAQGARGAFGNWIMHLVFLSFYLMAFMATPLWLATRTRWFRRPSAGESELAPAVAAKRAAVAWFALMHLPLLYVATGFFACARPAEGARAVVLNYPAVACGSTAFWSVVLVNAVILLPCILVALVGLGRRAWRMSMVNPSSGAGAIAHKTEDYLEIAFLYGHCNEKNTWAWALDYGISLAVVLPQRSFFRESAMPMAFGVVVPCLLLCVPALFVARSRGRLFAGRFSDTAYCLGLASLALAFIVRYKRSCAAAARGSGESMATAFFGVIMILTFLASVVFWVIAGYSQVSRKDQIEFPENYHAMQDDGDGGAQLNLEPVDNDPQQPQEF